MIEFICDEKLVRGPKGEWSNYFKGVSYFYLPNMPEGHIGYDAVYLSNVTIGGGISSSAAVEVCSFLAFHLGVSGTLHRALLGNRAGPEGSCHARLQRGARVCPDAVRRDGSTDLLVRSVRQGVADRLHFPRHPALRHFLRHVLIASRVAGDATEAVRAHGAQAGEQPVHGAREGVSGGGASAEGAVQHGLRAASGGAVSWSNAGDAGEHEGLDAGERVPSRVLRSFLRE